MNATIILVESEIAMFPDVHDWLIDKLSLPEWYGRNLDALWDCITAYIKLPVTIKWIPDSANDQDYSAFIELLQDAADEVSGITFEYIRDEM